MLCQILSYFWQPILRKDALIAMMFHGLDLSDIYFSGAVKQNSSCNGSIREICWPLDSCLLLFLSQMNIQAKQFICVCACTHVHMLCVGKSQQTYIKSNSTEISSCRNFGSIVKSYYAFPLVRGKLY